MRLPHHLANSPYFLFNSFSELLRATTGIDDAEVGELHRLDALGLPPVTSRHVLATMIGITPSLIWSFEQRPQRYYRTFNIPKGKKVRRIDAPKVGIKLIQKWLSIQFQKIYVPPEHVFGFIAGRSHVAAASMHTDATWVFSVDIRDFFQTTPKIEVKNRLIELGFSQRSSDLITSLCCLNGSLAQGAPSSPILSNIAFRHFDIELSKIAEKYNLRLTRYADDIVFSGRNSAPASLKDEVEEIFSRSPWKLATEKTELINLPNRLKVHGLLVHGKQVRLTKGYRNRIRAYKHLLASKEINSEDKSKMIGHISYGNFVEKNN